MRVEHRTFLSQSKSGADTSAPLFPYSQSNRPITLKSLTVKFCQEEERSVSLT